MGPHCSQPGRSTPMNSSLRIACLLSTFLFLTACSGEPQGGWLYFGPECPEGYSNCSNPRTQEPRLVILADNEPRGIGITFQCEHDGMTARFSPGAGGSLGGAGTATMEIEVGQAGHSSLVLQRRFKVVHPWRGEGRPDVWREIDQPGGYAAVFLPASAAIPPVRTAAGEESPAPPGTPGAG